MVCSHPCPRSCLFVSAPRMLMLFYASKGYIEATVSLLEDFTLKNSCWTRYEVPGTSETRSAELARAAKLCCRRSCTSRSTQPTGAGQATATLCACIDTVSAKKMAGMLMGNFMKFRSPDATPCSLFSPKLKFNIQTRKVSKSLRSTHVYSVDTLALVFHFNK